MDEVRARRLILGKLYNARRRTRPGVLEGRELISDLGLAMEDLQFHIDYLVEKGLVEVGTPAIGPRKFRLFLITTDGIDLFEDPSEFNGRFPPQVVVQNVLGDHLEITIGDHASNVSVGKGTTQTTHILQIGASTNSLEDICAQFLQDLENAPALELEQIAQVGEQIRRLVGILTKQDIDLGEIQRIKRFLAEREGRPAYRTALLFSHDVVTRPINQAVENLIGYPEGSVRDV